MKPDVDAYVRFRALDAVLDVARFPLSARKPHEVAVKAMQVFAERYSERLTALNPGKDVSGYFHITIAPEVESGERVLVGEEISIDELFGDGYDVAADQLLLFEYQGTARSSCTLEGLAHALLDTPYGLRLPLTFDALGAESSMHALLRAFCSEVLALDDPRDSDHLCIRRWPTDWSNYFDAGHEWWGAFFWTIEDARRDWVTVVAASSTD